MDRRAFLRATGTAAAMSAVLVATESVQAEGFRQFEQLHEKLTEADLDRWTAPLPFPPDLVPKPITKDDVRNSRLGGGSQGIAEEFYGTVKAPAAPLPPKTTGPLPNPSQNAVADYQKARSSAIGPHSQVV